MKQTSEGKRDLNHQLMTASRDAALKIIQNELGLDEADAEAYYRVGNANDFLTALWEWNSQTSVYTP